MSTVLVSFRGEISETIYNNLEMNLSILPGKVLSQRSRRKVLDKCREISEVAGEEVYARLKNNQGEYIYVSLVGEW